MIEYITETGIFGFLWIVSLLAFLGLFIYSIRKSLKYTVIVIFPLAVVFFLFNQISLVLIGKTSFDKALIIIRDSWFLLFPATASCILIALNRFTSQHGGEE